MSGATILVASFAAQGIAQSSPAVASAPSVVADTLQWDSLVAHHRHFELRDQVAAYSGPLSPRLRSYRGQSYLAFSRCADAVADLRAVVANPDASVALGSRLAAAVSLSKAYDCLYRYRESAVMWHDIINKYGAQFDSATRAGVGTFAAMADGLSGVGPMQVRWTSKAATDTLTSVRTSVLAQLLYKVPIAINDSAVALPMLFDTGSDVNFIDESTATHYHVRIIPVTATVNTLFGPTQARMGVIPSLTIGAATLTNVFTLIVPDGAQADGSVLGLRALQALGVVTFLPNGSIVLTDPARQPKPDPGVPTLAVEGNLVMRGTHDGKPVTLKLDTGADVTIFYPPFLSEFPSVTSGAQNINQLLNGTNGTVAANLLALKPVTLAFGGVSVPIPAPHATRDQINPWSADYAGNIGQDALQAMSALVLDFRTMTVRGVK